MADLAGHTSTVTCLAFSADGRRMISGSDDGTAIVWDMEAIAKVAAKNRPAAPKNLQEVEKAWSDLNSADALTALRATCALASGGGRTVAFLADRLPVATPPKADEVRMLIADLDSGKYATRDQARKKLAAMGPAVGEMLRDELAKTKSAEVKASVKLLLESLGNTAGKQQQLRCVEVFRRIGGPSAVALLKKLAGGFEGSPVTQAARNALQQLRPPSARAGGR